MANRRNGASPLFMACQEGHFEVVIYLVEKGANIDQACTDDGQVIFLRFFFFFGGNLNELEPFIFSM
jgi:hypothetical protein